MCFFLFIKNQFLIFLINIPSTLMASIKDCFPLKKKLIMFQSCGQYFEGVLQLFWATSTLFLARQPGLLALCAETRLMAQGLPPRANPGPHPRNFLLLSLSFYKLKCSQNKVVGYRVRDRAKMDHKITFQHGGGQNKRSQEVTLENALIMATSFSL